MPAVCYSSIKGLAMRATRLNTIGRWATGASASAVSDGFINVSMAANVEAGTEYKTKKASGALCVNTKERDSINWFDLTIDFCEVNPELLELVTGVRLLKDYALTDVGFSIPTQVPETHFALEIWTKVNNPQTAHQWIYWLLPHLTNAVLGDFTMGDEVMTVQVRANTLLNANWGFGPYNVQATNVGLTPGKLSERVNTDDHLYHKLVEIAPPTAVCGYVTQPFVWIAPV